MNAEELLKYLDQLSRADKVTLAVRLLKPAQPDKSQKFDLATAMQFIANAPPPFKYPVSQTLLEAEKACGGELSKDDVINVAVTLLFLSQDHQGIPCPGGLTATPAHDFAMQANLHQIMMRD
jgi:hypothetical protein